jgi:hypothetical protein
MIKHKIMQLRQPNKTLENDRLIARFFRQFVLMRSFLPFPTFFNIGRRRLNSALGGPLALATLVRLSGCEMCRLSRPPSGFAPFGGWHGKLPTQFPPPTDGGSSRSPLDSG